MVQTTYTGDGQPHTIASSTGDYAAPPPAEFSRPGSQRAPCPPPHTVLARSMQTGRGT